MSFFYINKTQLLTPPDKRLAIQDLESSSLSLSVSLSHTHAHTRTHTWNDPFSLMSNRGSVINFFKQIKNLSEIQNLSVSCSKLNVA